MTIIITEKEFIDLYVEASSEIDKETTPEVTDQNKAIHSLMKLHNSVRDAAICANIIKKYKSRIMEGQKNG